VKLKKPIPLDCISHPLLIEKGISLEVLRIDQSDPIVSGNKWFKLKYNLLQAKQEGFKTLLSFGGPFSNHLHALAAAGKAQQFNTIGIIRGEEHLPLNPTLSDAVNNGMKLYYVDRKTYRKKHLPEVNDLIVSNIIAAQTTENDLKKENIYIIPEGGTNELAIKGAAEIVSFIPQSADFICLACGTGGTLAGVLSAVNQSNKHHARILGFPALKGAEFLHEHILSLLSQDTITTSWQLFYNYHFGGFGKLNHQLVQFMQQFETDHAIELDPIYTAKMLFAVFDLIECNFFPKGSRIIAIHTGGIQGKRGMQHKIQSLLNNANNNE
jgi:1-aminocyclopropane-1-carboxylate deaminase